MKFILLLILVAPFFAKEGNAQSKKHKGDTTRSQYIPVEGRSDGVPQNLEGSWVLASGLKTIQPAINAINKKAVPGTEISRDSVSTTTTVNGETRTTTEVNVERVAVPLKQVTPLQKENMHKADKPSISFFGLNETFSGFTGCNKYSGRYKVSGNKISLSDAAASTKMLCLGEYDEKDFITALKRVNSYKTDNGMLELLDGDEVVLSFSRK